jgi:peptidoglycan/xylan/chitin deacetylase (PgdA/CDA1 family)
VQNEFFSHGSAVHVPMTSYRADRFATLHVFHPLYQMGAFPKNGAPVLMYHSISDDTEDVHPYYQTTTSPQVFAEHMRFLSENRYSVISLGELVSAMRQGRSLSDCVVITFDDGFRDFYRHAFPVLQRYGFSATMFLPTDYIGETERLFQRRACMTWSEVRELHRAGMRFGSHTVTHPQLRSTTSKEREHELRHSKRVIEDRLGTSVESFSYPFAFPEQSRDFTQELRAELEKCGYRNGVSTVIGRATADHDQLFLKRLPVNSHDDILLFKAKLDGAYDWLHVAQYMVKVLRRHA